LGEKQQDVMRIAYCVMRKINGIRNTQYVANKATGEM
jgi:hypothetical protein